MSKRKSKAKFPDQPAQQAPDEWLSIDPAGGRKPSVAVRWRGSEAVAIINIDHKDRDQVRLVVGKAALIVVEEGGYVGPNPSASLQLERVRERFESAAWFQDVEYVGVGPDQWRMVHRMPSRPRRAAVDAGRQLCELLSRPESRPRVPLAMRCSNDDKRAAMLIGWACVRAWGWR